MALVYLAMTLIVVGVGAMIFQAVDRRRHPQPANSAAGAAGAAAPSPAQSDNNSTGAL